MGDYSAMSDRELDAAVAEKVFGWRWIHEDSEQPWAVPYLVGPSSSVYYPTVHAKFPNVPKSGGDLPNYSTDIAAAWAVVDRVIELDFSCFGGMTDCELVMNPYTHKWRAAFSWSGGESSTGVHEFAPRAICLAALAAVGAKEKTNA